MSNKSFWNRSLAFRQLALLAVVLWSLPGCEAPDSTERTEMSSSEFLRWNGHEWTGALRTSAFDADVELVVLASEAGLSDRQREIVAHVSNFNRGTRENIEKLVFHHYQSRVFGSIDPIERTPKLSRASEIWNHLESMEVMIPSDKAIGSEHMFGMVFDCSWDTEHGLYVIFHGENPVRIGDAAELY